LNSPCVNGEFSHSNIIVYEYFGLMLEMKKSQVSFNGEPNMFFGKIVSCTCDLHLKLDILNSSNTIFLWNCLKIEPFALQPFPLKFLFNLVFHQVHPMNMYFHRRGHVFVVQKVWNQSYDYMHSFWFLF